MHNLDFHVESAQPEPFSVVPLLLFKLRIDQPENSPPIHTITLRCQIRIEPGRRRYSPQQQKALLELFGLPPQWAQSLRPMLWTHATAIVPAFTTSILADLPVPCTWDFNIAATKYFEALGEDGDIPLCLLFSGTVFSQENGQPLQATPIPWDKEATFRLPAATWQKVIDHFYPNTALLSLNKETFDRLRQFKIDSGHLSWEQTLEDLLQTENRARSVSEGICAPNIHTTLADATGSVLETQQRLPQ